MERTPSPAVVNRRRRLYPPLPPASQPASSSKILWTRFLSAVIFFVSITALSWFRPLLGPMSDSLIWTPETQSPEEDSPLIPTQPNSPITATDGGPSRESTLVDVMASEPQGDETRSSLTDDATVVGLDLAIESESISRSGGAWAFDGDDEDEYWGNNDLSQEEIDLAEQVERLSLQPKPKALDLPFFAISHDRFTQQLMERLKISWAVQYEIARGESQGLWSWSAVNENKLKQLTGANTAAAKVGRVILGSSARRSSSNAELIAICAELDREHAATIEGQHRGLGLQGAWQGISQWYGGRIQQIATVVEDGRTFSVRLERMEKRRSSRFARFFGSRRFLQLRIPRKLMSSRGPAVQEFLADREFVLCGRVYIPFFSKEDGAYLFEVNKDLDRTACAYEGDEYRVSLAGFLRWHNPIELNSNQTANKWSTRFALGLSTSVPALEFDAQNILECDDVYADGCTEVEKSQPEKNMTDGRGFMNLAALIAIGKVVGLSTVPMAVQGRIVGAKGLWILHPTDRLPSDPPRIWIAPSQRKIRLLGFTGDTNDRVHRIFDLVAPPRASTSKLSKDVIVNLSANGVPDDVFVDLFRQGLQDEVSHLTLWAQSKEPTVHDMLFLWHAVHRAGKVASSRTRRAIGGLARALGFGRNMDEERGMDLPYNPDELTPATDPDRQNSDARLQGDPNLVAFPGRQDYSGAPTSLHETTLELIQAGFEPGKSAYLFDKLRFVVKTTIDDYVPQLNIPLPRSMTVFVIPDPFDCLEEGEIFFKTSRPFADPETGISHDVLEGPALVGRHPTALPHDIRKVMAVAKKELMDYYDVVVFSVKGQRSAASWLSGGDYDGDTVFVIWEGRLVDRFWNADFAAEPRNFVHNNFEKRTEPLQDLQHHPKRLISVLLQGLRPTNTGIYSNFHAMALYRLGYNHHQTIRLGYMYTTCLDSQKSGLTVSQTVRQRDGREWDVFEMPECFAPASLMESKPRLRREVNGVFILDLLGKIGREEKERHLEAFDKLRPSTDVLNNREEELLQPLADAHAYASFLKTAGASQMSDHLNGLRDIIMDAFKSYADLMKSLGRNPPPSRQNSLASSTTGSQPSTSTSASRTQSLRDVAEIFWFTPPGSPPLPNVDAIRASMAYEISIQKYKPGFVFEMAFQEICAIKAKGLGSRGRVAFTRDFAQTLSLSNSSLKALRALLQEDPGGEA